jgi:ribosomal protein S18 acetylase RimI-like enzyme
MNITIQKAKESDFEAIYDIFREVISTGEFYIYEADTTFDEAYQILMVNTIVYVARFDEKIVGFYLIRQNKVGRGSHVCNAAYMVHKDYRRQHIGQQMCESSLKEARKMGYEAMQFNIVVSTNHKAVALWMKMGFEVVGTIPKAFDHAKLGKGDAYVMHRFL